MMMIFRARDLALLHLLALLVGCSSSSSGAKRAPLADAGAGAGGTPTGAAGASGTVGRGSGGAAGGSSASGGSAQGGTGPSGTGGLVASGGGTPGAGGVTASGGKSSVGGSAGTGTIGSVAPSSTDILAKVAACTGTAIKGGFGLDGAGSVSMYQCGPVVYWKADLDVDCDGIQTPPCDTDPQGQPQTSIVDAAPNGDVDPTKLPYFVIPLGKPETAWYTAYGIELGQVGAVVYRGQLKYGIFADEAGGWFIGEASYAMCQLFLGAPSGSGDPCSPISGGIDPAEITYVTFTGAANRASGADIYNHDKHTEMGVAAAKAWLAAP